MSAQPCGKVRKNKVLDETEKEMIGVPRRKACQEDSACTSRTYMNLTVVEQERALGIALKVLVNTYLE